MVLFPETLTNLIRALRLVLYRMVKRVRRLVGGQTEVARICGYQREPGAAAVPHTSAMTAALWLEWRTSKRLQSVFEQHAKDPDMSVDSTAALICGSKRIANAPAVTANLKCCLQEIKCVNELIVAIKGMASKPFNKDDEQHEKMLEQLWQHLLPGQERAGGRYTREWGRIGFQQSDPASDFRGGGLLGLEQLLYLASNRNNIARRMISEPAAESSRYPWACVGINLTVEAIRILEERKIDAMFYGKSLPDAVQVFHSFYSDMFEILHRRWVAAKPENLLAFPPVRKETIAEVEAEVAKHGCLVPPGAEA